MEWKREWGGGHGIGASLDRAMGVKGGRAWNGAPCIAVPHTSHDSACTLTIGCF